MKTNRRATAGPPSAAAWPTVAKIPDPIMAAMPNAVRSRTRKVRFSAPPCSASIRSRSDSMAICWMDLRRNSSFAMASNTQYQIFPVAKTTIQTLMKKGPPSPRWSLLDRNDGARRRSHLPLFALSKLRSWWASSAKFRFPVGADLVTSNLPSRYADQRHAAVPEDRRKLTKLFMPADPKDTLAKVLSLLGFNVT